MGTEKIYEFMAEMGWNRGKLAEKCRLNYKAFCAALKSGKIGQKTADKLDHYTGGKIPYESLTQIPRPAKNRKRKKKEELF